MGLLHVEGIDDITRMLDKISALDEGKVVEDMLKEGAKDVEKAWTDNIRKRDYIDTGKMLSKVNTGRVKKNQWGRFNTTYPFGEHVRPWGKVRNAAKAFYLHYGFQGRIGSRWVDDVEKDASKTAPDTMQKVFDKFIEQKGK